MSGPDDLPPLPPSVRALLERADEPEPAPGLEHRIWSHLTAMPVPNSAPNDAPPVTPAAPASALHAAMGKWGLLATVSALAVGAVGGAVTRGAIDARSAAPAVSIAAPVNASPPEPPPIPVVPPSSDAGLPPPAVSSAPSPATPAPSVNSRQPGRRDRDLAEEQTLLETARSALMRREPRLSLLPLREHATRFPHGQLAEERDGLWVQSLASAGEIASARAKADEFRRKYPQSLLLPAIEAAVGASE